MKISTPIDRETLANLKAGEKVLLSGTIYSARDAAHKRIIELINNKEDLPFELKDQLIYYVGPSPTPEGKIIGSAGPTTSYRMDPYAPTLLDLGLAGMIGKGDRGQNVINSIKKNKAVYFTCVGGAAALISSNIVKSEVIAFDELGPEAIRRMEVKDFPLFVTIDSEGNNLYTQATK